MSKKILLINTGQNIPEIFNIIKELNSDFLKLSLLACDKHLLKIGRKNNWPTKKILCPRHLDKKINLNLFFLFLPVYLLLFLPLMAILKWRDRCSLVVCFNDFEKIIFTPLARLLKIKVLWFIFPETDCNKINRVLFKLLHIAANDVGLITPAYSVKQKLLVAGFKNDITVIPLAANLNLYRHQDNIFSKIASTDNHWSQRKYFTIGTIVDLDDKKNIETLLNTTTKITDVISFPQIIIIGEGKERKNLTWLAKKLDVENFVWFVGEQTNLKKWLDTFDLFVVTASELKLKDLNIIIRAMSAGLPIIGPNNIGLEEIISGNEKEILLNPEDSEELAQTIIKIQQRKDWRSLIGEKNKIKANTEFSLEKSLEVFTKLFS